MESIYPDEGYCDNRGTNKYPQYYTDGATDNVHELRSARHSWAIIGTLSNLREEEKPGMVSKLLSTTLLVSRAEFAKLDAAKQTETLVSASGKPIVFVDNFQALKNKRSLIERLMRGEDVSMELEFNEIELTSEEKGVFAQVKPIIDRLTEVISGGYEFVTPTEEEAERIKRMTFGANRITNSAGYQLTTNTAKKVWLAASKYWAGGEKPTTFRAQAHYESRSITFPTDSTVKIGCQTISRAEVEAAAKHYDWDFEPA
jgi:hypothetical protein